MARKASPLRRSLRRAALWAGGALALSALALVALWAALPDPSPLARAAPATTALIEQRRAEARAHRRVLHPLRTWVPLERIPRQVVAAVLASEDDRFFEHEGIDWTAIRDAAEHDLARGRFARGASTITQQLAKNLWLGTERSLWRKAKEAILAYKLERALSKRRILALYLNVVELDDGVFGVEAGARDRFGVDAADLSAAQGVVLAAMLPAPRRVDLRRPSTWLQRRARRLLDRLVQSGRLDPEEHQHAAAELDRILAGPRPDQDEEEPPDDGGGEG
ncbi:MAG TPA: monofunctional biosynthetic peptidoglycan transglycosylase [Anaeromyxobacter sp.]|nr:monofunctional biosynthetic peptidoglycan transglycosylase [Anaeromyxobacter sp.]